jgi:hypothetical protein
MKNDTEIPVFLYKKTPAQILKFGDRVAPVDATLNGSRCLATCTRSNRVDSKW